ncbi:perlucin-like protein [Mytilus edulis]|uniref:perlucin-like protein n=1 Tax=Mytilus edulis TaxID=6550 RepID=UPI0039F11011
MKIVIILLEMFCIVLAMSLKQRSGQLNAGSGNQLLWYFLNKVEKLDTKMDKIQQENTEIKSKLNGLQADVRLLKDTTKKLCDHGWFQFRNNCYLFTYTSVTWDHARDMCKSKKSNLVKINDADENRWLGTKITNAGKTQIWLGGSDPTGRNTWMWISDFTELNYKNWSPGNPSSNDEQCMMMYSKSFKWNDGECYSKRGGYICEKRL